MFEKVLDSRLVLVDLLKLLENRAVSLLQHLRQILLKNIKLF